VAVAHLILVRPTARRGICRRLSPEKLDDNSGVAFNRLTYENIRSHTHHHGDLDLGQRRPR
jgi:hypothetical protein